MKFLYGETVIHDDELKIVCRPQHYHMHDENLMYLRSINENNVHRVNTRDVTPYFSNTYSQDMQKLRSSYKATFDKIKMELLTRALNREITTEFAEGLIAMIDEVSDKAGEIV